MVAGAVCTSRESGSFRDEGGRKKQHVRKRFWCIQKETQFEDKTNSLSHIEVFAVSAKPVFRWDVGLLGRMQRASASVYELVFFYYCSLYIFSHFCLEN